MKRKLYLILMIVTMIVVTTYASDKYTYDTSILPTVAQTMLKHNFKADVSVIKIDKDLGRISEYEVTLTNGTAITFDREGNWKEIEVSRRGAVPETLVPSAISAYVTKNIPKTRIIGIEKTRRGYEIELSNGADLRFDKSGNYKSYDD